MHVQGQVLSFPAPLSPLPLTLLMMYIVSNTLTNLRVFQCHRKTCRSSERERERETTTAAKLFPSLWWGIFLKQLRLSNSHHGSITLRGLRVMDHTAASQPVVYISTRQYERNMHRVRASSSSSSSASAAFHSACGPHAYNPCHTSSRLSRAN
jgi:hypothetical protein